MTKNTPIPDAPAIALDLTPVSIGLKLWGVILWYCVDPHALGIRFYEPSRWGPARGWTRYF